MSHSVTIVIFGASGDLTKRKLLPALYSLHTQQMLTACSMIIGVGRTSFTDTQYRQYIAAQTGIKDKYFLQKISYLQFDTENTIAYIALKEKLESESTTSCSPQDIIYYCSTPPSLYTTIAQGLATYNLHTTGKERKGSIKIIFEKPFGYDLISNLLLDKELKKIFSEEQIYRIDHYVAKETVQNILVTRFANTIFEPLWNNTYIDHIQITAAEEIGVENRGKYYDGSGALRDMIQNHLLQVMAIVMMEAPKQATAEALRDETVALLSRIRPYTPKDIKNNIIRGQYQKTSINGKIIPGYREEKDVDAHSMTETFVALKLYVDNERWSGVPVYIRSGKYLHTKVTEVVIQFKRNTIVQLPGLNINDEANQLIFRIQPHEGIVLRMMVKNPGVGYQTLQSNMHFSFEHDNRLHLPDAYERLLLDCINSDQLLYIRHDALVATWKFVSPILDFWKAHPEHNLFPYIPGTWGPMAANDLIGNDGFMWRNCCNGLAEKCICIM